MSVIKNEDELIIRCSCGDKMSHFATLIYEPWEDRGNNIKSEHDDWYLSVALETFSFWKRLKLAWNYMWNKSTPYGNFIEIVLTNQDVKDIADWIKGKNR